MYVVAMTAAVLIVGFADQCFKLRLPPTQLLVQTIQAYTFNFLNSPQYNGSFIAFAAISVSWSLAYEWMFYASLPLICLSGLRRYWFVGLPLALMLNKFVFHFQWIPYFICESLVYELSRFEYIRKKCSYLIFGVLSAAGFLLTFYYGKSLGGSLCAIALSTAFLPIAAGNDWGGVLSNSGIRVIGAISYSIYLLNIIVEAQFAPFLPKALISSNIFIITMFMTLGMMVLLLISYFTYSFIEFPFLNKKKTSVNAKTIVPNVCV